MMRETAKPTIPLMVILVKEREGGNRSLDGLVANLAVVGDS